MFSTFKFIFFADLGIEIALFQKSPRKDYESYSIYAI